MTAPFHHGSAGDHSHPRVVAIGCAVIPQQRLMRRTCEHDDQQSLFLTSPRPQRHRVRMNLQRMREPVLKGVTRPERWRREQLRRLRNLVTEHEAAILEALHQDLAKPPLEAMTEVVALLQELKLAERRLRSVDATATHPRPNPAKAWSGRPDPGTPGCVLLIGPWNSAIQSDLWPLVSALAAGNTAVIKPSEHARPPPS